MCRSYSLLVTKCAYNLQPQIFRCMRADLASMWSHSKLSNLRKLSARSSSLALKNRKNLAPLQESVESDKENISMKVMNLYN